MIWTTAAYAMGANPQGQGGEGNPLIQLAPFLIMIVIFYFLIIRPQQKRSKQHKSMLGALKVGDKIITAGGMYGRIVKIDDEKAVVDLGDSQVTIGRAYLNMAPGSAGSDAPKA